MKGAEVDCGDEVIEPEAGKTFTCAVEGTKEVEKVEVRLKDDEGRQFEWRTR